MVPWLHALGQDIMAAGVCGGGDCSPHGTLEAESEEEPGTRYNLQK
jgi:hypothetical protein